MAEGRWKDTRVPVWKTARLLAGGLVLAAALLHSCLWAPDPELLTYKPGEAFEGLTLFGIMGQPEFFDWNHGCINTVPMVSRYPLPGRLDPVWEYTGNQGGLVLDSKLLPTGTILAVRGMFFGNHVEEIDPATNETLWEYREEDVHHDADILPDGNIIFLSGSMLSDPVYGLMRADHIRVTDRAGTLRWDWSLHEHDPAGNPRAPGECTPIMPLPWVEWSHCNAVTFVPDAGWSEGEALNGEVYLSCRHFNRIYKIAYPSGDIQWVLGDNGDFGDGLFSQAHDPEISFSMDDEGDRVTNIMLFDNGSCRPAGPCPPDEEPCPPGIDFYSRALEIRIEKEDDPSRRSAAIVWKWPSPHNPDFESNRFFSEIMGDADLLPNGNVLITSSTEEGSFFDFRNPSRGRLIEVKRDGTLTGGEKVWEMATSPGYGIYRAQRIPVTDWPFSNSTGSAPGQGTWP